MQMYHRSVLPDVYLTSVFGTPNAMGGGYFRARGYQAGLKDIEAEYQIKFNKAKTKSEKNAIKKEMDEVLEDLEAARDLYKGVYGVSDDPSSFYSKGISLIKMFNAMTSLQGGLASIVDLGRSVFYNGFNRTMRATWESFDKNLYKTISEMRLKEGRISGELFEMQMNTRAMLLNDLSNIYNTGSKINAGMQKMSGAFFMINLMSPFNQIVKKHMSGMITTRILEECENWANGTITKANILKLSQSGIDEAIARKIFNEYVEHGWGVNAKNNSAKIKYNRFDNSSKWIDQDVANIFNLARQNDINIGIITPSLGDTPLWMSTQLGGVLAQFKKFSMGMHQRLLIRGLQEKDASFLGTVISMVILGAVVDMMRSRAFDQDYSQKSFNKKIIDAFERSGVGSVFMDVANAGHRIIADDFGGKLGGALGPTGSNIDKIINVISADQPDQFASNVRRLIPFQNIWYMDSLFDQIEQGIQ